jgi:hypothetical protein
MPKVYVKCYVRNADGTVKFPPTFAAGSTTRRSARRKSAPVRYAVVVLSNDRDVAIKEAAPPQR